MHFFRSLFILIVLGASAYGDLLFSKTAQATSIEDISNRAIEKSLSTLPSETADTQVEAETKAHPPEEFLALKEKATQMIAEKSSSHSKGLEKNTADLQKKIKTWVRDLTHEKNNTYKKTYQKYLDKIDPKTHRLRNPKSTFRKFPPSIAELFASSYRKQKALDQELLDEGDKLYPFYRKRLETMIEELRVAGSHDEALFLRKELNKIGNTPKSFLRAFGANPDFHR